MSLKLSVVHGIFIYRYLNVCLNLAIPLIVIHLVINDYILTLLDPASEISGSNKSFNSKQVIKQFLSKDGVSDTF